MKKNALDKALKEMYRQSDARIATGRGNPTVLDALRLLDAGLKEGHITGAEREAAGKVMTKLMLAKSDGVAVTLSAEDRATMEAIFPKVGLHFQA